MSTSPEPTAPARRVPAASLRDPALALAFGFGAGLVPRAPGTVGSLLALPLHLAITGWPPAVQAMALAIAFWVGVVVCGRAARALGTHDHPGIVWDEVVGCLIALLPAAGSWAAMLVGFAAFRLLDIWKPWPIRLVDRRVGGGFGIMLDDLLAGAGAAAILWLARLSGAPW